MPLILNKIGTRGAERYYLSKYAFYINEMIVVRENMFIFIHEIKSPILL